MTEEEFRKGTPEKTDIGRIKAMSNAISLARWENDTAENLATVALKTLREYES